MTRSVGIRVGAMVIVYPCRAVPANSVPCQVATYPLRFFSFYLDFFKRVNFPAIRRVGVTAVFEVLFRIFNRH